MNIQLVESLVTIINALSVEERQLLQKKVKINGEMSPANINVDQSAQDWIEKLQNWSISHRQNTPLLSDEAVSRQGIYEERRR
ncbi:hypothetical protein PA905_16040 [Planktothrix agardhii CCAP 1459/11A]|uniref:Uncharacterized protein n=1 Tax=Planktothrix agardhii CCAP 1459/11A TaxID=282420 RepID=A0A4P5ZFE3_PLAAG|nr:hypothetical protein [Planktothrix agardhii]GDZ93764.1 hypothetical protein PA905_16040 [Planktothrix agardhii CCAP 1459/11A]